MTGKKQILIQHSKNEIQVGILENRKLVELLIEREDRNYTVGNIYLGKVQKVIQGLQASFIDIGEKIDGFLHFSDVSTTNEDYQQLIQEDDLELDNDDFDDEKPVEKNAPQKKESNSERQKSHTQLIAGKLKENDLILVQVIKEPIGTKGYRLTSDITLAGRFMVLLPFGNGNFAISKKINNRRERNRLKNIVRSMLPNKNFGAIIRTMAANQDEEILKMDIENLLTKWRSIEDMIKNAKTPTLVYREENLILSTLRDSLVKEVEDIITNSPKIHQEVLSFLNWAAPTMKSRLRLHRGNLPLFQAFGVSKDVESVTEKKVWLKSGGYLIIEHTEAMVVIDVNTGRAILKKEQEENSLKTNMEAATEVARQLRLRDIGGIIVVDFIDLLETGNANKVFETLRNELRNDKAKSNILPMSDFGLIQITRERIRPSLAQRMREQCPTCDGSGAILYRRTTFQQIERWIRKYSLTPKTSFSTLNLYINPTLFDSDEIEDKKRLSWKWFAQHLVWVSIKPDKSLQGDKFVFFSPKEKKDITETFIRS